MYVWMGRAVEWVARRELRIPFPFPLVQVKLGLSHLMGTNLLRAYMHGFFIDNRLYSKAKVWACGRVKGVGRAGGFGCLHLHGQRLYSKAKVGQAHVVVG